MREIIYIIRKEYLSRVQNRLFIITAFLSPFFVSLIFILPIYMESQNKKNPIGLVDKCNLFHINENISHKLFLNIPNFDIDSIKNMINTNKIEGAILLQKDNNKYIAKYYSETRPSLSLVKNIRSSIHEELLNNYFHTKGFQNYKHSIDSIKNQVDFYTINVLDNTEEKDILYFKNSVCIFLGFFIYLMILVFSSQVMRSILEEKSNRIIEILITSVSPLKLIIGKIVGIALLGLTQIIILITVILLSIYTYITCVGPDINTIEGFRLLQNLDINYETFLKELLTINFNQIILLFIFFFLAGYLLYTSLFAIIASSIRTSSEIRQLSSLITLLLFLAVLVLTTTINSPDSNISYIFSIIPFTSPIVMMGRIVYGVSSHELIISILILILTLSVSTYLAAKIYCGAILFSGKKITSRDIVSWILNK